MPKLPVIVNAVFDDGAEVVTLAFDKPTTVNAFLAGDWEIEHGGFIWNFDSLVNITSTELEGDVSVTAVPAAGNDVSYDNSNDGLIDDIGRSLDSFAEFPFSDGVEVVSATFSTGTGETLLTFSGDVVLCDTSKKPWAVRVGLVKQTVQGVTQPASNQIAVATNADGPAAAGDVVSYDSASGCLETPLGARVGAIFEAPLTIIP